MTIRRIDLSSLEAQRAWDVRAVDAPGGDVHQGSAWLTYRASLGREAVALEIDDAPLGILLNRAPLFGLPKGHAPRGPLAPWGATVAQAVAVAERIQRVATWLGAEYGLVALDADPWLPAGEATESAFRNAGLQKTDEIFPSQHTMVLRASATGTSEADLFEGITKSTRQRIALAERAGFVAERITHLTPAPERTALWAKVQILLEATAQRKSHSRTPPSGCVPNSNRRAYACTGCIPARSTRASRRAIRTRKPRRSSTRTKCSTRSSAARTTFIPRSAPKKSSPPCAPTRSASSANGSGAFATIRCVEYAAPRRWHHGAQVQRPRRFAS